MSDIYSEQIRLIGLIRSALPGLNVVDNILPPLPNTFPLIAVDPVSADTRTYAGGTQDLHRFSFDIFITESLANHHDRLSDARAKLSSLTATILAIPRVYAASVIFGEDVIGTTRVTYSIIKCTFPI